VIALFINLSRGFIKPLDKTSDMYYYRNMEQMSADTIREWVAKAEADLAESTAEAERLQRRIAQMRTQLGLMYELLATVTDEPVTRLSEAEGSGKSMRERVVEAVILILREHGKPMRIQDIHSEFLRRELPLPGSGTPANIAAHLVDRDLFTRPGRGAFALAEWELPNPSASVEDT
jgi:uncharacterized protein (DUF2267 family)